MVANKKTPLQESLTIIILGHTVQDVRTVVSGVADHCLENAISSSALLTSSLFPNLSIGAHNVSVVGF